MLPCARAERPRGLVAAAPCERRRRSRPRPLRSAPPPPPGPPPPRSPSPTAFASVLRPDPRGSARGSGPARQPPGRWSETQVRPPQPPPPVPAVPTRSDCRGSRSRRFFTSTALPPLRNAPPEAEVTARASGQSALSRAPEVSERRASDRASARPGFPRPRPAAAPADATLRPAASAAPDRPVGRGARAPGLVARGDSLWERVWASGHLNEQPVPIRFVARCRRGSVARFFTPNTGAAAARVSAAGTDHVPAGTRALRARGEAPGPGSLRPRVPQSLSPGPALRRVGRDPLIRP